MENCQYIYIKTKYLLNNDITCFFEEMKDLAKKGNTNAIIEFSCLCGNNELKHIDLEQITTINYLDAFALAIKNFMQDTELFNLLIDYENLQRRADDISILGCLVKKEQLEDFNQIAQDLDLLRKEIYLNRSYTNLKRQMINSYKKYLKGDNNSLIIYNYGLFILCKTFECLPNSARLKREHKQNTNKLTNSIKFKLATNQNVSDFEFLFYAENLLKSKNATKRNMAKNILQGLETKYRGYATNYNFYKQ